MTRPCGTEDWRLSAFLDDELAEAEASELTRHLAACDRCYEETDRLRAARSALRALGSTTGDAHPDADRATAWIADAVAAEERRRARQHRVARRVALPLGVFVAFGALAFVAGDAPADEPVVRPPMEEWVADHVVRTGGGPILVPVSGP